MPKSFPSQFNQTVNFSSTGADVDFGFPAGYLRLRNDASKSIYVRLDSTTGATTSGYEVASSDALEWYSPGVGCSGLSFVATSSGGNLRIGAWG